MDSLTVSDGTDVVTLTGGPERWLVELRIDDVGEPGEPSDERGTPAERGRRLLEAATHAVGLEGGGRLEYWIERVDDRSDEVPTRAGFVPWRDLMRLRRELPALPGVPRGQQPGLRLASRAGRDDAGRPGRQAGRTVVRP